jgi:hypothetical protein
VVNAFVQHLCERAEVPGEVAVTPDGARVHRPLDLLVAERDHLTTGLMEAQAEIISGTTTMLPFRKR